MIGLIKLIGGIAVVVIASLWYWHTPDWEPLLVLIGSSVALVIHIVTSTRESRFLDKVKQRLRPIRDRVFFKEPVPLDELDAFYPVIVKVFGEDITGLPELRKMLRKNPNSMWRVGLEELSDSTSRPSYIGFFEVFPLTNRTTKAVLEGSTDARTFRHSDIRSKNHTGPNYYIASIGVIPDITDSRETAKAAVLRELKSYIAALNQARALTLCARSVTADGLRLLTRHGFEKVCRDSSDETSVWIRRLKKGELSLSGAFT